MMRLRLRLPCFLLAFVAGCAGGPQAGWTERPDFGRYFREAGVDGTFVLYDLREDAYHVYDPVRARTPYIPASTFKIFNALVALETGAIQDAVQTLPWDGVDRGFNAWNQDHNLRSGMRVSAVWFYQELARRIGPRRMQHYLDLAGYGNRDIGGGIDRFWLEGDLRITPIEQVDFLVRLHRDDLPFSQRSLDLVKDILIVEETADYVLRAKTGWAGQVGWYVGYLTRGADAYFFATNLDVHDDEDAEARVALTRRILADTGLL